MGDGNYENHGNWAEKQWQVHTSMRLEQENSTKGTCGHHNNTRTRNNRPATIGREEKNDAGKTLLPGFPDFEIRTAAGP